MNTSADLQPAAAIGAHASYKQVRALVSRKEPTNSTSGRVLRQASARRATPARSSALAGLNRSMSTALQTCRRRDAGRPASRYARDSPGLTLRYRSALPIRPIRQAAQGAHARGLVVDARLQRQHEPLPEQPAQHDQQDGFPRKPVKVDDVEVPRPTRMNAEREARAAAARLRDGASTSTKTRRIGTPSFGRPRRQQRIRWTWSARRSRRSRPSARTTRSRLETAAAQLGKYAPVTISTRGLTRTARECPQRRRRSGGCRSAARPRHAPPTRQTALLLCDDQRFDRRGDPRLVVRCDHRIPERADQVRRCAARRRQRENRLAGRQIIDRACSGGTESLVGGRVDERAERRRQSARAGALGKRQPSGEFDDVDRAPARRPARDATRAACRQTTMRSSRCERPAPASAASARSSDSGVRMPS